FARLRLVMGTCDQRPLASFPTRRSSDLGDRLELLAGRGQQSHLDAVLREERGLSAQEVQRRGDGGGVQELHRGPPGEGKGVRRRDRKSTRLNSSHVKISYAVFCVKKKKT